MDSIVWNQHENVDVICNSLYDNCNCDSALLFCRGKASKKTSSQDDVQKVVDAFRSLKGSIPQIAAFEYGTDNSPEGLANGFTHCFLVTFKSEADRDVYLPHPKHKEFVEVLKPHLDKVQVLDYWAAD